jgi:transcriptional regulator with XRE-family HTH domain
MGTLRRSQARRAHPAAPAARGRSAAADKPSLAKPKANGAAATGEPAGDGPPAEALQQNLRAMRARRQMTLEELANSAGLTRGYLSLVERGLKVPSISALLKIASALDVNMAQLFDAEATTAPKYTVYRSGPAGALSDGATMLTPLAPHMSRKLMEPFLLRPPFKQSSIGRHRGDEMLFILSGQIELILAGEKIVLSAGESIYFGAEQEHVLRSIGSELAEVLVVIAGPH